MKVCIIGNNLTSLALAKALVNKEIFVDILYKYKNISLDKTRTIGLSKSNINFFIKNISNINKILWPIKKIKIFSENSGNKEIIKFNDPNNNLFSIMSNYKLYNQLNSELCKNKYYKSKKSISLKSLIKLDHDLIINCDHNHEITKKLFFKKFEKNYDSFAFTTIIEHKKLIMNNTAIQIFTNRGPVAFLPISNNKTSVVYSMRSKVNENNFDMKKFISRFNSFYEIQKINKISKFQLKALSLRKYYKSNILAFGDLLHKLHPLAGQGFNMSVRDINKLLNVIDRRIELGLPLDQTVCKEFQNQTKSDNFIFSEGIDFVYEFFNSQNTIRNKLVDTTIKYIGKNKFLNEYFKKIADVGLKT
tara:strand:+ start:1619 stop:2701 length:1083 start_codon:yes stop_codon:yes gene_type:complete